MVLSLARAAETGVAVENGLDGIEPVHVRIWLGCTLVSCEDHGGKVQRPHVPGCNDLKPRYNADAAEEAFEAKWADRYPAIGLMWRRNWERFIPFLDFDPAICKIIYTTNAIESLNYQLRKVTKARGSFPTDDAVYKIFYLAFGNIGTTRGGPLGTHTQGWRRALNAFVINYPDRIDLTTLN